MNGGARRGSAAGHSEILTLSNTQAKELAGRLVTIGTETYCFKDYDREYPGQPPWRSGAEGKAYPLVGYGHSVVAYMKFFTRPTPKRLERTAWLIAQQVHSWQPSLAAAPMLWGDTRFASGLTNGTFHFAGYLAKAVPGRTWLELKGSIAGGSVAFNSGLRLRCVCELLLALSVLEGEDIVHGDLSPNNIVVDVDARPDQPTLYLIDFDAFVAPAAGTGRAVTVAEGGTYGTEGYCPLDLSAAVNDGDGAAAPYSDRYGRDMLLMELLLMNAGLSVDDPPSCWNCDQLQQGYAALRARTDSTYLPLLSHLDPATVFTLAEQDRPSSAQIASVLGLTVTRKPLRSMSRVRATTPVVLGHSVGRSQGSQLSPRWGPARPGSAMLHNFVPWSWTRPEGDPLYRSIWQDIKVIVLVMLPVLVVLIIGLLTAIFGK
jgi:hypothetical protein